MPNKRIITKEQVLKAMKNTQSNMAAARYLGCSYQHYKRYSKLYKNEEGKTLFDAHLNQTGIGIKKFMGGHDDTPLIDILEGRARIESFTVDKLKHRLIKDAFLEEKCSKCGFEERRVVDFRVPLILNFKDQNKKNWQLENLEFNCYNCQFLYIGNVFSDKQLRQMENYEIHSSSSIKPEDIWDLDPSHMEHLKELGLWENEENDDDELDLIDYK